MKAPNYIRIDCDECGSIVHVNPADPASFDCPVCGEDLREDDEEMEDEG